MAATSKWITNCKCASQLQVDASLGKDSINSGFKSIAIAFLYQKMQSVPAILTTKHRATVSWSVAYARSKAQAAGSRREESQPRLVRPPKRAARMEEKG